MALITISAVQMTHLLLRYHLERGEWQRFYFCMLLCNDASVMTHEHLLYPDATHSLSLSGNGLYLKGAGRVWVASKFVMPSAPPLLR